MDETDSSFEHFCRVCATESNQLQSLFEITHNGVNLAEMLSHCLKRPVNRIDGLPGSICASCKPNLIFTYEFHSLCEASEQYFSKRSMPNKVANELDAFSSSKENQNSETIDAQIKIEDDYELTQQQTIVDEALDFDCRPTLASELVCVEENFDINNIIEESQEICESPLPSSRVRQCSSTKGTHLLRRVKHKSDDSIFECFECKRRFDQLHELRQHMNGHDNNRKPFECSTCNMRFVHLNSWFRHRSKHTKNIHECEYCTQSFNTLTGVKQHIQDMHKDNLKAYKCDQCSEEFALRFLLIWHLEWHKKAKKFVCSTCDAVFFNERKLKAHIRDNHANHLCAECGKSFKTIHSLASHQMLHTEEKPFACDLCPSRFKWKAALRTHVLVHTGQKQHICDICGSSFTTKGSMKKHKRIHTQDRRYQCETCSMKFYSNDHLKRHKRTHTGERPYVCSYCPRSFSQSNDLTKHLRSHVGQNMYRCHCGESFRLQTELRKHSYTHYNKDDPETLKTEQPQ